MNKPSGIEESASRKWKISLWVFIAAIGIPLIVMLLSVITLRWVDPSATSFTIREDWETLEMERYNLRDYWVEADEIPNHMKWAVVASEDQLFWEHRGFDVESIQEAWEDRQEGGRVRGAEEAVDADHVEFDPFLIESERELEELLNIDTDSASQDPG